MKKTFPLFIFILMAFVSCKQKRDVFFNDDIPKLTGDVRRDVNTLIPGGKVTVEVMDGVKRDLRLAELQTRYQKGAREHYEWYVEYIKNYNIAEPIPYHENFGLTPEEYHERQTRMNNVSFYSTGLDEIEVIKQDGIIHFRTSKKLKKFENISFNLKNNTANVGDYVLQYADSITIKTPQNVFRSKWKGYVWTYENPTGIHLDALKDVTGLNMVRYKITVGLLEDGRTLINLKATEVSEGVIVIDFELPLLI